MQEEVTTGSVVADSATIDTATIEDLTADEIHNVTNAEIDNITNQTIKSNGKIALPQPMATPSDWYTITVPKDVRAVLKGSYVTENETSVDYNFEVNYGNVYFHQEVMDVVKDILFDEDNVYIRVRSSTDIDYWATYNNTSEEITIEKSSNPEALYDFVPQEEDGIVFKGFNDEEAEFEFPGKVHVKKFLADVIEYDELEEEYLEETYSDEELDDMLGKVYNIQKIDDIYRRKKYGEERLFAHSICVNCGRDKRVFLSNLINDPDKYGSCICSDTNIESKIDNIEHLYDGSKKLASNTSGYTGVSLVKTYKGEPYNKWRAYIEVDGVRTYLGDFDSKAKAIKARKTAGEKGIKWYKDNKNKLMRDVRRKTKKYQNSKYRETAKKRTVLKKDKK